MSKITTPWFPRIGDGLCAIVPLTITTTAVPTANKAWIVPVTFPAAGTLISMSIRPNGANGNFDMGLFLPSYAKIQTLGTTACMDAEQTLTFTTPISIAAGALYYASCVFSSTSEFVFNQAAANSGTVDRCGVMEQASALPLPDPLVPVKTTTLVYIPYFKFAFFGPAFVTLSDLLGASHAVLFDQLAKCIEELTEVIEQLGFLREQELQAQRLAWNGVVEDSVTKRDRAAKFASVEISGEIYRLSATRDALVERKFFILKLLDRDHG